MLITELCHQFTIELKVTGLQPPATDANDLREEKKSLHNYVNHMCDGTMSLTPC